MGACVRARAPAREFEAGGGHNHGRRGTERGVGRAWADTHAGLDASNKDGHINMQKWNIYGMLMPDTVKAYTATDGVEYLVTANEGDDKVSPGGSCTGVW